MTPSEKEEIQSASEVGPGDPIPDIQMDFSAGLVPALGSHV